MSDSIYTKKFKLKNPYKPDENITQEVVVGTMPVFDYSDKPWVAIDTEFLNLNFAYDRLCTIQIASPTEEGKQQVEIIWVWEAVNSGQMDDLSNFFKKLISNKDLEVLMHVSTADLPRIEKIAQTRLMGKIFDTKVAGKITITNQNNHGLNNLINYLVDPKFNKDKEQTGSQWDAHPSRWSDKMVEYAMNDVVYLHPLKEKLIEIAKRRNLYPLVEESMYLLPTLAQLVKYGYDEKVLVY